MDPIKFTSHAAQLHVDAPLEGNSRKKLSQKAGQVCLSLDAIASRNYHYGSNIKAQEKRSKVYAAIFLCMTHYTFEAFDSLACFYDCVIRFRWLQAIHFHRLQSTGVVVSTPSILASTILHRD